MRCSLGRRCKLRYIARNGPWCGRDAGHGGGSFFDGSTATTVFEYRDISSQLLWMIMTRNDTALHFAHFNLLASDNICW